MAKPSKPSKARAKGKPAKAAPKRKEPAKAKAAKPSRKVPGGASAKPAKAKPRRAARIPRLPPAELQRRLDIARDAATNPPLRKRWHQAMERMRDHFGNATGIEPKLAITTPPAAKKGTPWAMVARISAFDGTCGWAEAYAAFSDAEADDRLESLIGEKRLCRIGARYKGPETGEGGPKVERDFTLSEIAPWPFCISHAANRCSTDSEESLAARYKRTEVKAVYVWISLEESKGSQNWL